MRNTLKFLFLFSFFGSVYCLLETVFRGWTHESMFIVGGICGLIIYAVTVGTRLPMWSKWVVCGAAITCVELIAGLIINVWLGLSVWSYKEHPLNIYGQICPLFSLIWVAISIPASGICLLLKEKVLPAMLPPSDA